MAILRINTAFKLAATYASLGTLWLVLNEASVSRDSPHGLVDWGRNSIQGLLFVGVTAVLFYFLAQRLIRPPPAPEQELQEARKRWHFALQSAGTGTWEWNGETGEAYFSPEWKAMLGYADHELANRQDEWLGRIHPDDRAQVDEQMQRHMRGETPTYECEFRLRTKDGSYKWILARGQIVSRQPDGRPREAFGTHTDITDRKNAEARTADALAFAQAILRSSPLGMVVYGPDGRTVIGNDAAARIIGTEMAALLRQNFRELESWRRTGLLEAAERVLATGRSETQRVSLGADSRRQFQVEIQFAPFDFQGARHLLVIIEDETAERQALANLHLLHAALQAAPSGWVITDAEGVIEWVNPAFARMTGYTAAEAVGQTPRLLRSDRHKADFYRQFWSTIKRGEVWSGEICNRRKDGTVYNERMTVAPVRDEDGVIRHFVAIKDDITERKQLEQQLTRTQRLESIGMLASGIAHDLNNVLTPILLSIELLKAKYIEGEALKYIDTVQTAGQRGAGIVRQILTFARGIEGGERTEVQPRYLLKDVVSLIEETFPRNLEITHNVPHDVHPVVGDLTQLHQVLLNLAVNARDAMPEGGTLTLAARNQPVTEGTDLLQARLKPGNYVALTVTDTGSGIPPEVLEHIFEPFFTTKPRGKGTGLGLSTVYGIVNSHGGTINVQTRLGQGTTFEILLPAAPVASNLGTATLRPPTLLGASRRVLVVDDEEPIRTMTARVLTEHGFRVVTAVDGCEGWREFQAHPDGFAAAIVDVMMPRMNGTELAQQMHAAAPDLPIIIVTGIMSSDTFPPGEVDWTAMGVRLVLNKPYGQPELVKALAKALARSSTS